MSQLEHLVKMANQIALNMGAWGDEEQVAGQVANHLSRFWTADMLSQLDGARSELSAPVVLALKQIDDQASAE